MARLVFHASRRAANGAPTPSWYAAAMRRTKGEPTAPRDGAPRLLPTPSSDGYSAAAGPQRRGARRAERLTRSSP
jgi:alpha-beta hydrolase superfamily lysophospholipase